MEKDFLGHCESLTQNICSFFVQEVPTCFFAQTSLLRELAWRNLLRNLSKEVGQKGSASSLQTKVGNLMCGHNLAYNRFYLDCDRYLVPIASYIEPRREQHKLCRECSSGLTLGPGHPPGKAPTNSHDSYLDVRS